MRLFQLCKDGGEYSTVWAYVLVEIKWLFSIMFLRFENGSREAYHTHAFHCISWVLSGELEEFIKDEPGSERYKPSFWPIITRRTTFHKVVSHGRTWVFTLRGPWRNTWQEFIPDDKQTVTLTHGRKVVA